MYNSPTRSSRHTHHRYVVAVKENLVQLCDPPSFGRGLILRHVLQYHVHKVIKPKQSSNDLLVALHDDVDTGANTLVHQLCSGEGIVSDL